MRNRDFFLFSIAVVLSALGLMSCLNEPTIPKPSLPVAVLRFGNFASNIPAMNITVDGKAVESTLTGLAYTGLSNYFELFSGTRTVVAINTANGDTIFNKVLSISPNHIVTLLFTGFYSTTSAVNTFEQMNFDEGLIYVSNFPKAGTANLHFINLISTLKTDGGTDVAAPVIDFRDQAPGKDLLLAKDINPTADENVYPVGNVTPGFSKFVATLGYRPATVYGSDTVTVQPDKNYFIFASGTATNIKVVIRSANPVPVTQR